MAENFIGTTMTVTLSQPPGAQLRGTVSAVAAGKSLTLRDVYTHNGRHISDITINAADISDLKEYHPPNENALEQPVQDIQEPLPSRRPSHHVVPVATQAVFSDPAIVTVGRPSRKPSTVENPTVDVNPVSPSSSSSSSPPDIIPARMHSLAPGLIQVQPSMLNALNNSSINTLNHNANDEIMPRRRGQNGKQIGRKMTPAAVLVDPMEKMTMNGDGAVAGNDETGDGAANGARRKRNHRNRNRNKTSKPPVSGSDAKQTDPTDKGWRQSPLLEPNPSFQPYKALRRKNMISADSGWATEDATDVQEMGDFDFQASLRNFDKRSVFEGIRAGDMTADEDRLVGHNRRLTPSKPGTMGGKNLHPTENVLDSVPKQEWNSEGSESDDEMGSTTRGAIGSGNGSGRNSIRAHSRLGRPSSKSEIIPKRPTRVNTSTSAITPRSRSQAKVAAGKLGTTGNQSAFYLVPADRRVDIASALQMLNLENIANTELGLTEDMMTENAGRGIAEVALWNLSPAAARKTAKGPTVAQPYVIIYAGNNKSGIRAIAAGRHLRNHGGNVIVCVLGIEREPELLEGIRRQLKVYRSFGGKVLNKNELIEAVSAQDITVELIVDGLLGLTISFEELRMGDQAAAYELIEFANRSTADVLAIDVPTGMDPTSGSPMVVEDRELWIKPSAVVAMGVPKTGLLEAMRMGFGTEEGRSWKLWVADIGIAKNVWKKAGMRQRRGVEFEGSWVLGMRFQKGSD